jgi:chromosome segregation ATPase
VIALQHVMLVALGFLLACLIVVALVPAYWARAVRLTTQRIRQSMPLTEAEIRADKDRLRAEYAIRIHKLETQLEQGKLAAARQQVELNRRDAAINALEREVERLVPALEEHQNARRVLEQTVKERVLVVEQQLSEARKLLEQRNGGLAALKADTVRSVRSLDEALQINAQQRAEIERLTMALSTRGIRPRDVGSETKSNGEVALRSELEALRAKSREQADVIARLQAKVQTASSPLQPTAAAAIAHNGVPASRSEDSELERLQRDLADAEAALKAVRDKAAAGQAAQAALEVQIETLQATSEERASTIKRLEASLAAYEAEGAESQGPSLKESKTALKARLRGLQSEVAEQSEVITKLRAELAASNERLALQSAQFRDEIRKLGGGTLAASTQPRRSDTARPKRSLAERIGQTAPQTGTPASSPPRLAKVPAAAQASAPAATRQEPAAAPADPGVPAENAGHRQSAESGAPEAAANGTPVSHETSTADQKRSHHKQRLLDRIASLDKS